MMDMEENMERSKLNLKELLKLRKHDLFWGDVSCLPIGIPVIIRNTTKIMERKWYNPISWFKPIRVFVFEYIGDEPIDKNW